MADGSGRRPAKENRRPVCVGKLGGKAKRDAVDRLGRGHIRGFGQCGPETEKNPRKMLEPIGVRPPSSESIFKGAVEAFHKAIGLRVIGGGGTVMNVKLLTETEPQSGSELGAMVRSDVIRNAMAGDPGTHQSIST